MSTDMWDERLAKARNAWNDWYSTLTPKQQAMAEELDGLIGPNGYDPSNYNAVKGIIEAGYVRISTPQDTSEELTNRDVFSRMTNEELAEFIVNNRAQCHVCIYKRSSCYDKDCKESIVKFFEAKNTTGKYEE